MRHLALALVFVCLVSCTAMHAATDLGGVLQTPSCPAEDSCGGGGHGSILEPLAIIGATALGIAAVYYVYTLVRPDVRVTLSAPPP